MWEIALAALRELGGDIGDVVRTRQYVTEHRASWMRSAGCTARCSPASVPASTMVVVAGLLDPRWYYEAELDAIVT